MKGAPNIIVAIFGLESTDIAFLGLLFGVMSAILVPLVYFLINISKNMNYLMNYTKSHEEKAEKEAEKLDKVVTKQAITDTKVRSLEYKVFKRSGAISQGEENGNQYS